MSRVSNKKTASGGWQFMANLNTDLVRDTLAEAIWESYRKGWLNDKEYQDMMDDFSYHFSQMINVVEERPLKPSQIDWSRPGARYEDDQVIIH